MGFLNPGNLLWALSLAILTIIYLRSRSRPTVEVSSLILFDEAAAPATRVRHLRIDPLFWLEAGVLAAIAMALAGLYIRTASSPARGRSRALVIDIAAAMSARAGGATRLDDARRAALALIASAPERDQFSVIAYADDAVMVHPESSSRKSLRDAIAALRPRIVPVNGAALSAALMRASAAGEVHLFADREPPQSILADAGVASRIRFHQAGAPADNLAIVSLDPGIPKNSPGRMVLRNFAPRAHQCDFVLECAGKPILRRTLILGPREQVVVPFGPLTAGGLVHAQITSTDALAADNQRYAWAPTDTAERVLVLSPDGASRDDLARVLLGLNSNFVVTASSPDGFRATSGANYDLAVMHDCYVPSVRADSILMVYPARDAAVAIPELKIEGSVPIAEMTQSRRETSATAPAVLGATRVMMTPGWMTVQTYGTGAGRLDMLPLSALGAFQQSRFGLIAYDLRGHLLFDPDRLDALVEVVDLLRDLVAPAQAHVVSTGSFVSLPVPDDASLKGPDGNNLPISRDQWGRVRVRPLDPGKYEIASSSGGSDIYANYFDASESDLTGDAAVSAQPAPAARAASLGGPRQIQRLTIALMLLALAALAIESAVLMRRIQRWGTMHV